MSMIRRSTFGDSLCASTNGWLAIRMWAGAIAPFPAREIGGYSIITPHLGSLLQGVPGQEAAANRLIFGRLDCPPLETSKILLGLDGTEAGPALGSRITEELEERLMEQAKTLRRITDEMVTPVQPLFRPGAESEPNPIDDDSQVIAYGASLKVGAKGLTERLARLYNRVTSGTPALTTDAEFLTELEQGRRSLADLQRYYRTLSTAPVSLIEFKLQIYREPLEWLAEALREFERIQEAGPSRQPKSKSKIRNLLLRTASELAISIQLN